MRLRLEALPETIVTLRHFSCLACGAVQLLRRLGHSSSQNITCYSENSYLPVCIVPALISAILQRLRSVQDVCKYCASYPDRLGRTGVLPAAIPCHLTLYCAPPSILHRVPYRAKLSALLMFMGPCIIFIVE